MAGGHRREDDEEHEKASEEGEAVEVVMELQVWASMVISWTGRVKRELSRDVEKKRRKEVKDSA